MEQKQRQLHLVANNEAKGDLDEVAAAIRPLPREVEPSEQFLGELRLRLLKLEPGRKPRKDSRQAA